MKAVLLVLAFMIFLAPLVVAAATQSDVIPVLKEVIGGIIQAGKDAYCATGVTALCPK